jgi:hypothetical protein
MSLIQFRFKAEVRFVMTMYQVDLNLPYKDQNVVLISKIIEKVSIILYYLMIRIRMKIMIIFYSSKKEIRIRQSGKGVGS